MYNAFWQYNKVTEAKFPWFFLSRHISLADISFRWWPFGMIFGCCGGSKIQKKHVLVCSVWGNDPNWHSKLDKRNLHESKSWFADSFSAHAYFTQWFSSYDDSSAQMEVFFFWKVPRRTSCIHIHVVDTHLYTYNVDQLSICNLYIENASEVRLVAKRVRGQYPA